MSAAASLLLLFALACPARAAGVDAALGAGVRDHRVEREAARKLHEAIAAARVRLDRLRERCKSRPESASVRVRFRRSALGPELTRPLGRALQWVCAGPDDKRHHPGLLSTALDRSASEGPQAALRPLRDAQASLDLIEMDVLALDETHPLRAHVAGELQAVRASLAGAVADYLEATAR